MEKRHAADLRKGRASIAGEIYLVTAVTHLRKPYFSELQHGRVLVNALRHHDREGSTETLAFVVMPDHLHWLMTLKGEKDLSQVMHGVKGYSGRQIKAIRGRKAAPARDDQESELAAPVWQEGFHDHALRREEDLVDVARYIVMNPVRAGLVTSIWQYSLWDAIWIE